MGCGVKAQCPNFNEIYQKVSQPLDPLINDKGLLIQNKYLKTCYSQWIKCGTKPDSTFGLLLLRLGVVASWSGQTEDAILWYRKSLNIFLKTGQNTRTSSIPKVNYLIGECYLLNNNYTKAKPIFEQVLKLPEQPATITFKINSYLQLAYIQTDFGDYEKALNLLTSGIQIAKKYQNDRLLIQLNYQKAYILRRLERFKEAISMTFSTIHLSQKKKLTDELIKNYESLGTLYAANKNIDSALYFYTKTLGIAQKTKRPIPNQLFNNIGYMYQLSRQTDEALFYYNKALQIEKDPSHRALMIHNIGSIASQKKQYQIALLQFQEAFNTMALNKKKLKSVEENPNAEAIKISIRKQYLLLIIQDKADTWLDYYKSTNTKSHLTNALKNYALADSMIDFMRYEHVGEGSKLFWRQKTRGMYERAIEASYLAGDAEAAFRFFEKSKAVLLSDKLNELGANQQLTESSAKRQRTLRDSIANLQNQLASLPANDAKRSEIQRRLEQFNDDFEAFRKQLESTNPAYYRYKYDNSTPTIAEFQKSISTNGSGARTVGFVSYFVGDSAIYAFCLDQKARLVRLSLRPSDYQSLANEFLSLCADRSRLNAHYPQYRALAHRLYQLLWKPLGMTASRVIISQDGVFLPFETLLVQPNQNDFLLKHHAISYTYSANFLAKNQTDLAPSLHQGDKLFHRSFVGFAPETFQPSLRQASLKGSVAALEAVEEKFWWGKTLKNNEATKAQFMRYAPNSRVIQLFTHADADSTEAVEPRIYFHDAALRLSELTQADRFAAQLLVLSACKTGVGQNQRGEGVFSLARGFAALGIPSTITTLWSVEDQPTYELTKLFYNYLDQGLPKDEALQRAKLDWLNQGDAADALPSQWAGMILVGDTAPLAMDGLRFIVLGLGLLGLGVLGGVWWWRRKK